MYNYTFYLDSHIYFVLVHNMERFAKFKEMIKSLLEGIFIPVLSCTKI